MKLSTKVLVVGGGPAGSIAARSLAEWGFEVILLERNLLFEKPCGGGVPLSAFEEFCIPKEVIKQEVKHIKIVSPTGEELPIELRGGSLTIVDRKKFNIALRTEAEKKGAQVIEGEFTEISMGNNQCRVKANIKGIKTKVIAEYVIAADGVNSRVRNVLGIKPPKAFFTFSEKIKGIDTDFCEFWFGSSHAPDSYSWVFPALDGISAGTGSLRPGKAGTLFEIFRQKRGIIHSGVKRAYKVPVWDGTLYSKDNVIFAGDSAGQVMPLTYEGIYYAMKAGEFAARAIIEAKTLNYRRMWKSRFQQRFSLMDKLRNYFLKDDASREKLVILHRMPEIQEVSMRLWLRKDSGSKGLQTYIKLLREVLCSL